ncbi:unnamed protein product [Spirodela intermedia]|uniref:Uncharacterized protein n=1 Tax=Spirodela intermedia TaxID=51605 RepID=A0A7I8ISC9_SPIIN|nr:unnamed protein product [Spirodela intermedia]CAA6659873.1 unnamed protein product [Spirodela intermedia]
MGEGFSWLKLLAVALAVMLSLGQRPAAAAAEETIKKSMFLCPFPGGCKPPVKSRPLPANPYTRGCLAINRCRDGRLLLDPLSSSST